jgi:transcriptional regulator with XRE-family HTH domain
MERNSFGPKLKLLRVLKGKNQSEIASLLGVSRASVSHWERGRRRPTAFHIEKLKRIFPGLGELGEIEDE